MSGQWYRSRGKRGLDIVLAAGTMLVTSPLLLIVAIAIKVQDGGAVIFRQRRIGRDQIPFELFKFRSMQENVGDLPSDRALGLPITWVGRIIRRTNIDELPQLVNILRGDMTIVGPRPALPSQDELIAARSANGAFLVRPGLTGLAQVSAYDRMPVREKAACDGEYAAQITFLRDVLLILRTFGYLCRRPPIY